MPVKDKAVVLGGYGLIGAACCRALKAAGFHVVGVGRTAETGCRVVPGIDWLASDIARETDWGRMIEGAAVVVNASGALQDGLRDDLEQIHVGALSRLCAALRERQTRLVQISAAGVRPDARTEFFRTKARGDAVIRDAGIDHVILRPVLVVGPQAYGGTALLRAVAATPLVEPRVLADRPVSCVALEDVAQAVVIASERQIASGTVADLTEDGARSFAETVRRVREWQGFPAWQHSVPVPGVLLRLIGRGADVLGWLGWRSPLRTTALVQLENGIEGDSSIWKAAGGAEMRSLPQILDDLPATHQERLFAQTWALFPLAIGVLSLFWLLSGAIAVVRFDDATRVLTDRGIAAGLSATFVTVGIVADIILGAGLLIRRYARAACLGMVLISLAYLAAGTVLTSDLWADPLGPFVKVLPGIVLTLFVWAGLAER